MILFVLFVVMLSFSVRAQLFSYDPYPAMANIDPETAVLVHSVARDVENPKRNYLLKSRDEVFEDVWESLVVIDTCGLRISIYYQASDYYLKGNSFNQDWDSKLTIYIRPQGTETKDSLIIFRDDYLNGTWDRAWEKGEELDGEYLYGSQAYDDVQIKYIYYLQIILAYFGK